MWLTTYLQGSWAKTCFYMVCWGKGSKEGYYFMTQECDMKFEFLCLQIQLDWNPATPTHLGNVYAVGL